MPLRSIDYWFAEQWKKKWENKNAKRKKYVRILNAESQLLESFNQNLYLNDENVTNLIIETGLDFDEISNWYQTLRRKVNFYYKKCPDPNHKTSLHWNGMLGVKIEILKNWMEISKYRKVVISE